jgi:hypothetical protein
MAGTVLHKSLVTSRVVPVGKRTIRAPVGKLNLGSRKKWLWTGITRASLTATDLIQLGVRKRDQRGRSAPLLMLDVGIVRIDASDAFVIYSNGMK